MNFSKKDVITGLIVVLLIFLATYIYKKIKTPKLLPENVPVSVNFKKDFDIVDEIADNFKVNISEDQKLVDLKDVTGGNSRGIVTETEIYLDADSLPQGYFYQGWLEKDGELKSLGNFVEAKGGWILEYSKSQVEDYKKVIVSKERYLDSKVEEKLLEGSF